MAVHRRGPSRPTPKIRLPRLLLRVSHPLKTRARIFSALMPAPVTIVVTHTKWAKLA